MIPLYLLPIIHIFHGSEDVGHAILSANGISEPSRMLEE